MKKGLIVCMLLLGVFSIQSMEDIENNTNPINSNIVITRTLSNNTVSTEMLLSTVNTTKTFAKQLKMESFEKKLNTLHEVISTNMGEIANNISTNKSSFVYNFQQARDILNPREINFLSTMLISVVDTCVLTSEQSKIYFAMNDELKTSLGKCIKSLENNT